MFLQFMLQNDCLGAACQGIIYLVSHCSLLYKMEKLLHKCKLCSRFCTYNIRVFNDFVIEKPRNLKKCYANFEH
ncbi:hypothetical protein HOLleu_34304 [Holothuria leucospilota]|uniref:Uncharacterized protein n=1 Tax=Holothuria leucospilota TaxID=206669 RepID=A0A9Q0YL10_HOLLE|nr:hypothetical protein HOLleu_34304 [Holothuria leucospilota]